MLSKRRGSVARKRWGAPARKRPRRLRQSTGLFAQGGVRGADTALYRRCRRLLRDRRLEPAVAAVIRAQDAWMVAAAAALTLDRERRRAWARADAAILAAWAVTKVLSKALGRPRPYFPDCPPAYHRGDAQSFPSTHAATAFATAAAVPPLLPAAPLVAVAIATSLARVLLGEHYPSDVLAGAALGTAAAAPVRLAGHAKDGDD